jgi:hypothetical protein
MTLHHKKHHQTYVNGLNAAEASFAGSQSPKERIALLSALKFNGGGQLCLPRALSDYDRTCIFSILQATSTTPCSGRT